MKRLKGAFNPKDITLPWIQNFVGANLDAVCNLVIPGERVQCFNHATMYVDPDAKQGVLIDYVPISAGGKPLFGEAAYDSVVASHFFITRPQPMSILTLNGIDISKPSPSAMVIFWDYIVRQVRKLIHVKYKEKLTLMSFDNLLTCGVDPSQVFVAQLSCVQVCEVSGIRGKECSRYIDQCCASKLFSWQLLHAMQNKLTAGDLHKIVADTVLMGIQQ